MVIGVGCAWPGFFVCEYACALLYYEMAIPCLDYLFSSPAAVNRGLVFFKEKEETFHLHS